MTGASNQDAGCAGLSSTASLGDAMHDAGVGLMIGAGAAAIGAVGYALWPQARPGTPQAGSLHVAPAGSAGSGAGVIFSGTF